MCPPWVRGLTFASVVLCNTGPRSHIIGVPSVRHVGTVSVLCVSNLLKAITDRTLLKNLTKFRPLMLSLNEGEVGCNLVLLVYSFRFCVLFVTRCAWRVICARSLRTLRVAYFMCLCHFERGAFAEHAT